MSRQKQRVAKEMALASVLIVERFGTHVGIAKNRITLRYKGRVAHSLAVKRCERIIIHAKGIGLSSDLIRRCAAEGIAIDFIDHTATPYASLLTHHQSYAARTLAQLAIRNDPALHLAMARNFVWAKLKNQRNYLKYLDKHHHRAADAVKRLRRHADKTRTARNVDELMGLEGSGSALYWGALKTIVADKIDFPGRIAQGAVDPVNSALNYGYAILYGEVQKALVKAGLALHVSFLHALDDAKPTLVFDFIEPFRTFVVDRAVFTMINREEPLRTGSDGRLTEASRRLVARNVLERLGGFTRHDGASKRMKNVIQDEAYAFARAIDAQKPYRPFIGRY
jgi:CRISPR-associated endonuclease Cas1